LQQPYTENKEEGEQNHAQRLAHGIELRHA
jgi:hypothetical protein